MKLKAQSALAESLLVVPDSFKRTHPKAPVFIYYSPKLWRRIYVQGKRSFDLALRLECDPTVKAYNTSAPKQPIPLSGRAKAPEIAPAASSVDRVGKLSIHTFARSLDDAADELPDDQAWRAWCVEHQFNHVCWTPQLLREPRMLVSNHQRLILFVSRPGCPASLKVREAVLANLRCRRSMTFYELIRSLPALDEEDVKSAIATLLLDGQVHSDIDQQPLSMATELSAFHAFNQV